METIRVSRRESQILKMVLEEKLNSEIAKELNLNEKTIATYKLRLLKKTKSKTIIGLFLWNEIHKLVEIEEVEEKAYILSKVNLKWTLIPASLKKFWLEYRKTNI